MMRVRTRSAAHLAVFRGRNLPGPRIRSHRPSRGFATTNRIPTTLTRKFVPIQGSPDVYISHTPDGNKPASLNDPTLIIVFGWMDAALPHLYKYTEQYNTLYPGARQVLVRSFQSFFWSSQKTIDAEMLPAAKAIRELGLSSDRDRILVHTFSNGGCFKLVTLRDALISSQSTPSVAIPAKAVIFDSCPGDSNISGNVTAFAGPIRNPVAKALASIAFRSIFSCLHVWSAITGSGDPYTHLHDDLQSPKTLPTDIPKTFICSKTDELTPYQVVQRFADRAKSEGADVEVNLYENTPHVNHLKAGPEKYWEIVRRTWDRASKASSGK